MTNYEKMLAGVIYDPSDPEIMNEQYPFLDKLWEFNQLKLPIMKRRQHI